MGLRLVDSSPCVRKNHKIYVSEVVQEEISSQLKAEFSEKINNSENGLRKVLKHQWLQHIGDKTVLDHAYKMISQAKESMDEIAKKGVDEIWQSLQVEVLAIQPHHGASVMKSYFSGTPPFKKIKNREDFPDAFISEGAKDLKALITDENIHFVVADNTLRNSLSQINGVRVHKDLDEFVQCEDVEILARQNEFEKHWNETYDSILSKLPTLEDTFIAAIQAITYELAWKELHHSNIPDDNNEAFISVIEEPNEIVFMWEVCQKLWSRFTTIPFEFETMSEIQFSVYRGEVFELDDKIYVEHGDLLRLIIILMLVDQCELKFRGRSLSDLKTRNLIQKR